MWNPFYLSDGPSLLTQCKFLGDWDWIGDGIGMCKQTLKHISTEGSPPPPPRLSFATFSHDRGLNVDFAFQIFSCRFANSFRLAMKLVKGQGQHPKLCYCLDNERCIIPSGVHFVKIVQGKNHQSASNKFLNFLWKNFTIEFWFVVFLWSQSVRLSSMERKSIEHFHFLCRSIHDGFQPKSKQKILLQYVNKRSCFPHSEGSNCHI